MNITISMDDVLVEKARALASRQGTSLQEMLRRYVETLVGADPVDAVVDELMELFETSGGRSDGYRFRREDAYDEGRF